MATPSPVQFAIVAPPGGDLDITRSPSLSRDGRSVVFTVSRAGLSRSTCANWTNPRRSRCRARKAGSPRSFRRTANGSDFLPIRRSGRCFARAAPLSPSRTSPSWRHQKCVRQLGRARHDLLHARCIEGYLASVVTRRNALGGDDADGTRIVSPVASAAARRQEPPVQRDRRSARSAGVRAAAGRRRAEGVGARARHTLRAVGTPRLRSRRLADGGAV